MTREQYEATKHRLEEELRAGIELLERAHTAQLRALDLVWMLHAQEEAPAAAAPAPPAPAPPAAAPRRKTADEVWDDFEEVYSSLPSRFTRQDVCERLGYEPERGTLYRLLETFRREGRLRLQDRGSGRRASIYEKCEPGDG